MALVISAIGLNAEPAPAPAPDASKNAEAYGAGAIAASGFSGTRLQGQGVAPGVDPITKTVPDPDGITLRIYGADTLGGPIAGQLVNPPVALKYKAKDLGHVFGLAFDNEPPTATSTPGLYAGATSAFGLNIVGPDKDGDALPDRLRKGTPGAKFVEGQFGPGAEAGPGSIWKIDRATGAVSLFANLAADGSKNSGAGIGGLAFDPASRTLYASDLDTGLIHRLSIAEKGRDLSQFDHGVSGRPARGKPVFKDDGERTDITSPGFDPGKPATWHFTPVERRVDGLAIRNGRLYYAVAEGPEIWSVGLETDGAFKADARFETGVESEKPYPVTGIAFDRDGRLIVAQRGKLESPNDFSHFVESGPAQALRYQAEAPDDPATPALWKAEPEEYAVGNGKDHRASSGGLALQNAYKPDGSIDAASCGGTVVVSADVLGPERAAHGLQLSDIALVRPENVPLNRSAYIDLDARLDDAAARGFAGGVATVQDCTGAGAVPPVAGGGGGANFPPADGVGDGSFPPAASGDSTGEPAFPPLDGADTTVAPPDGVQPGVLTVAKTAAVTTCNPKGGCAFNVEVTNNGDEVPGPIVIAENIEAPQAALTGEPNAPWSCTKAAPFTCTHPGPVPANGKLDMQVVFAPNVAPDVKEIKNCAVLGAGAPLPAGGVAPAAPACATIALDPDAPVQTGPIIVAKKASGKCTSKGPCAFVITVTNSGNTEIKNFVIDEQIDAPQAALAGEPNAPWTCTKAAPFSCTHKGSLAAKASVDLNLSFTPNTPPEKKEVKNCAIPKQPPGAAPAPGPAVPAQPAPVPDKKAEVTPPARQTFAGNISTGKMYLIGSQCTEWKWTGQDGGFSVQQSNRIPVSFVQLNVDANGRVNGRARYPTDNGLMFGAVSGSFFKTHFDFNVKWDNGDTGHYVGDINSSGQPTGNTVNAQGSRATFTGIKNHWACVTNAFCEDYAGNAVLSATTFRQQNCGASPQPPSRWTLDRKEQLDFCMTRDSTADRIFADENKARSDALAKCAADQKTVAEKAKQNEALCGDFAKEKVATFGDISKRDCAAKAGIPAILDENAIKQECMIKTPLASQDELQKLKLPMRDTVSKCMAEVAAKGGGAGAGGAGAGGGPAVEPSPEQCAVVAIDPETKPVADNGKQGEPADQGNGLIVQKSGPAQCTKGQDCTFTIKVTNKPGAAMAGPITVFEAPDNPQGLGLLDGKGFAPPPAPWNCAKGIRVGCGHPGPVPPEGLTLTVPLPIAANATAKSVRNCASITAPLPAGNAAPEPSCVDIPLLEPGAQPAAPQVQTTKLILAKNPVASKCSDFGGGCEYLISITNPGPDEFNGPIEFTDVVKTPDNKPLLNATFQGLPGAILEEGIKADLECTKSGDGILCRTIIDVKIPANRTLLLHTMVKPGPVAGATAVKNCATLKGGDGEKCATIPLVDGPLLRARKTTAALTCMPECAFGVAIENVGNTDATGPFILNDIFTPASSIAEITKIEGDFNCSRQGDTLVCSATKNVIKPQEALRGRVLVKTNAKLPEYKNCLEIRSDVPVDADFPGRCKTINNSAPHLAIVKTGNPTCDLKKSCDFTIIVTNSGLTAYNGPITFTDEIPAVTDGGRAQSIPAGVETFANPDWTCTKPTVRSIVCTHKTQTLAPRASVTLKVIVTPGPDWKKNDVLMNCGSITKPIGNDPGADRSDVRSCFGTQLDPFAVKVAKTGDSACAPGSDCHFKISLFNPGPIDHNAPVTITDKLAGLSSAQIVSITPPLPCATQPTQIPFSCTSPGNVSLPLGGDPQIFDMVVRLPNDASAAQFSNCASVAPDANSPATEQACATVSTKPVAAATPADLTVVKTAVSDSCDETTPCNFKITVTNPNAEAFAGSILIQDRMGADKIPLAQYTLAGELPAPWTCFRAAGPGMQCSHPGPLAGKASVDLMLALQPMPGSLGTATAVNNCALVVGARARFQSCAGIPIKNIATKTPDALITPPDALVTPPDASASCVAGMVLTAGACACPPETHWNARSCVGTRATLPIPVFVPRPARPPVVRPAKPVDEGGGGSNRVKPSDDEDCPRGTEFRNGKCRPPRAVEPSPKAEPVCPASRPNGDYPNCCPDGSEFRRGRCVSTEPAPRPAPKPDAKCAPGQNRDPRSGVCFSCSHNDHFENGRCVPNTPSKPEPPECPASRPNGDFPNCCPNGSEFRRGRCVSTEPAPRPTPQPPRPAPQPPRPAPQPPRPAPQPPKPQPPKTCPPPTVGTYPNCVVPQCPANEQGRPPNCVCLPPYVKIKGFGCVPGGGGGGRKKAPDLDVR